MNITFYPSLNQALDSLKDNECLYSDYSWILRIKYSKKLLGYEPKSIVKEEESGKVLPKNTEYVNLLFRKKALEDVFEDLTSIIEKKGNLFKPPLKEAIALGIREINRNDKEFIHIGYTPSDEYRGSIREMIIKALKEEPWRKDFLGFGGIKEKVVREIEGKTGEIKHKYWSIKMVDKEMGNGLGGVVAKIWEEGRLLGLEIEELEKVLGEIAEEFGEEHLKRILPEVILKVLFDIKDVSEKTELIAVPFSAESTGQTGKRETGKIVDFFVFKKTEIMREKTIEWIPIKLEYIKREGLYEKTTRAVIKPSSFSVSIKIKQRRQGEKSTEGGKTFIDIWSSSFKQIEVISDYCAKDRKLEKKGLAVEKLTYMGKVYESRHIELDIDKEKLTVDIKKYEKKKGDIEKGKIQIKAYLGKEFTRRKSGCLEEYAIELIKKEVEKTIMKAKNYEKEERRKDIRRGIILSRIIAEKALEILEEGDKVKINCVNWGEWYRYDISPIVDKDYKPVKEENQLTKTIDSIAFGPTIAKNIKREIEYLENLSQSLCLSMDGIRKEIYVFGETEKAKEIRKLGKEAYYLKLLSDQMLKVSSEIIDDSWRYPKDLTNLRREIREADELSIKLSNIIASAIELPEYIEDKLSDEKVTEKIAREIIMRKIYRNLLASLIYGPYLDWRTILDSLAGIEIDAYFDEKIIVRLPTINEKFGYKVEPNIKRLILKPGSDSVEDVNIGWPVIYIDPGLDGKLVRIKVDYVER